jgi:hypothetical protein
VFSLLEGITLLPSIKTVKKIVLVLFWWYPSGISQARKNKDSFWKVKCPLLQAFRIGGRCCCQGIIPWEAREEVVPLFETLAFSKKEKSCTLKWAL